MASHGAILLFGKDALRNQLFPNASIRCARFQGTEKVDFIDQYDTNGTILEALETVLGFIRRNTRVSSHIRSMRREQVEEYPVVVIREILVNRLLSKYALMWKMALSGIFFVKFFDHMYTYALKIFQKICAKSAHFSHESLFRKKSNALVHADYSLRGMHLRLSIFSDRMEIESPGMFPFGFTLDDFYAGVSHTRNRVIARVFREFGYMEEWGTGYRRIQSICANFDYPIPVWNETGATIRVICPTRWEDRVEREEKVVLHLSSRQEKILKILGQGKELSTQEIQKQIDEPISLRSIRLDLSKLKQQQLVATRGNGPSTKWNVVSPKMGF